MPRRLRMQIRSAVLVRTHLGGAAKVYRSSARTLPWCQQARKICSPPRLTTELNHASPILLLLLLLLLHMSLSPADAIVGGSARNVTNVMAQGPHYTFFNTLIVAYNLKLDLQARAMDHNLCKITMYRRNNDRKCMPSPNAALISKFSTL